MALKLPLIVEGRKFLTLKAAAAFYGIGYSCLQRRIRCGWSIERAFNLIATDDICSGVVYLITNTKNSKVYVGVTVQKLNYRFNQHTKSARDNSGYKLHKAMRRIGIEKFSIKIIAKTKSRSKLQKLERKFIDKYDAINTGYNEAYGGGWFGNGVGTSITILGKTYASIKQAAVDLNIGYTTLQARLTRYNKNPIAELRDPKKPIEFKSKTFRSRQALATHLGMSYASLCNRINKGISLDQPVRPTTNPNGRRAHG